MAVAALVLPVLALGAPGEEPVKVSVSKEGFDPKVVNVRKGESLRLELTSGDTEHCFALDAFRVEKRILPGRTTIVEVVSDRVGTFPFYCCLESGAAAEREHGRLVVAE